jgi:hypothetical protein
MPQSVEGGKTGKNGKETKQEFVNNYACPQISSFLFPFPFFLPLTLASFRQTVAKVQNSEP